NFGANPPTYSSRAVVSDEVTLRIHLIFAFPSTDPFVAPVGPQTAGLHVVSQAHIQHFFLQMFPESWVLDGRNQLDAPVQVSLHPIRTANVDVFFASVKEIKDPAVLQESSDDTGHGDGVRQSRHSGPQRAHAANQQIYRNAFLRSFIQFANDLRVREAVDLGD